jgi:hypothetical protein
VFSAELNGTEAPTDAKKDGPTISLSVRRRIAITIHLHVFDDRLSLIAIAAGNQHAHSDHVPAIRKPLGVQGSIEVYGTHIVQLLAH